MKLAELNGTHIGKRVSIDTGGGHLAGTLFAVTHGCNRITDGRLVEPDRIMAGKPWVDVDVDSIKATHLDPACEVIVGA